MKKYTDVDIVAELQKLVDSHVDSYKEDFDIDKRIIRRAAESRNPEDKTLMWFCRPHGTHCLNENQVFIQGTRDHNTFRFYAEQTYDECVARVIIPKAVKRGKVFGDVFEINYREQAANVAQNSAVPDHDRLTFADGFVLEAPCRSSFDAAMALIGEHGGVKTYQTLPKDADALAEVLSKQKTRRDRLPDAERTESLSPLSVAELWKYEAVKKVHPDALVCFAQNGYFELYGKDAEKAAPLLGTKLLEKKVRGKNSMPVTGFREAAWVAGSHKLWKSGVDVFLSKDGETFKELKAADYIPVGATLNVDGIKCRIDAVDFAADEVRLTNIEDKNRPIRFSESIQYVRSYVEDAGTAIYPMFKTSIFDENNKVIGYEEKLDQVEADSIIICVSQAPKNKLVLTTDQLKTTEKGLLLTDENCMTTHEGVFAAGDVVQGANTVVHAVEEAKRAAEGMIRYMEREENE